MRTARWRLPLLVVLAAAAVFQLIHGFRPPMNLGGDFQWVGVRMLMHNVDPWAAKLAGIHSQRFSPPNYLHQLYILMLPLGFLKFPQALLVWQMFTLILSVATVISLRHSIGLSWRGGGILLLLLWASNPFRVTLAMGQQSILELYLFCLFFQLRHSSAKGIALGLSYAKYSFSPVMVMFLIFARRFKELAVSCMVPLAGLFAAWLILGGNLVHLALEPLVVSRLNVCSGFGDAMTLTDRLLSWNVQPNGLCVEPASALSLCIGLAGSVGYAFWLWWRRLAWDATMALLALAPLVFLRHLMYDFVFLLVPLAYLLKHGDRRVRVAVGSMTLLIWYAYRLVGLAKTPDNPRPLLIFNFLLLIMSMISIEQCALRKKRCEEVSVDVYR
jgi:hypothetical protein